MLEVTRFYFQGNPITLLLLGTPRKGVSNHLPEMFFAVNCTEVLPTLGLLSKEPDMDEEEGIDWCKERHEALVKYATPAHQVMMNEQEPYDITNFYYAGFRYAFCLRSVIPDCYQDELFNLTITMEDTINRMSRAMLARFNQSPITSTISPGEYIRVMRCSVLQKQLTGGTGAHFLRMTKELEDFTTEAELAKSLKMSRVALVKKLVSLGFLERNIDKLVASYRPSNMGSGYCDTRNGRKWHKSMITLISRKG